MKRAAAANGCFGVSGCRPCYKGQNPGKHGRLTFLAARAGSKSRIRSSIVHLTFLELRCVYRSLAFFAAQKTFGRRSPVFSENGHVFKAKPIKQRIGEVWKSFGNRLAAFGNAWERMGTAWKLIGTDGEPLVFCVLCALSRLALPGLIATKAHKEHKVRMGADEGPTSRDLAGFQSAAQDTNANNSFLAAEDGWGQGTLIAANHH